MSHRVFCPHCDAKLKFKKPPQQAIHCPKCKQPIEPSHFQNAIEIAAPPVEEAPPADPVSPAPSEGEESETYSFSTPAPRVAPATSPVDDDLAERIERQIKPRKKKKREPEEVEDEQEDSWFKLGVGGLVSSCWFLIYGGMGGGITWLHIVNVSAGFLFWTGVVIAAVCLPMVVYGIYEIATQGFFNVVSPEDLKKAGIFTALILGLVILVSRDIRNGDISFEDSENESSATANADGKSNPARAASPGNRRAQAADETAKQPAPTATVLLHADKRSRELVDFATLLKPREEGATAEITEEADDFVQIKLAPVPDLDRFAKNLQGIGFKPGNIDKDSAVVDFDPPPLHDYHPSQSHLFINPSIFKILPDIPYAEMHRLNKDCPGAEFTPIVGFRSGKFEAPNLPGETERIMRGGTCRTNALYGKLYLDDVVFSAFPRNYEPKDRRYRTGPVQEKNFGAKDGYVVTGLNVALDEGVPRGLQPLFSRYNEGEIDPSDTYVGEWMGLHEDLQITTLGGHERPVLGITCFGESAVAGIGLILQPAMERN